MLKNYLKIAWRNLKRHKFLAFINIFGLAIGVAFCLLIFLFIQNELSFDNFHADAHRIYRLHKTNLLEKPYATVSGGGFLNALKQQQQNKLIQLALPLGPLVAQDIPEVEQFIRYREGGTVISNGRHTFREDVRYVDKNFFQFFSFELKQGNKNTALADPGYVVISEKTARKYFGKENPMGKTLTRQQDGTKTFTVMGVAAEAPANSSLIFDILLPIENDPFYEIFRTELNAYFATLTFVKLKKYASATRFQEQLNHFTVNHFGAADSATRTDLKLQSNIAVSQLSFTPLMATHFDTSVNWPKVSNPLYAYILAGIGGLILLIASINYLSLALTNAAARVPEIGIRQVMGASRTQVARQLWLEAQIIVMLAGITGILMAKGFIPVFNYFTDKTLTFSLAQQPELLLFLAGLMLLMGVVSGGYPAIFLSGLEAVKIVKTNRTYRVNPWLSRSLVLVAYTFCLFLVTSSVIMFRQMDYISRKDLGFDTQQVLVLDNYAAEGLPTRHLTQQLQQFARTQPGIVSVTGTNGSFGKGNAPFQAKIQGEDVTGGSFGGDENYLSTLNITLVQGRNFSPAIKSDSNAILINQTLAAKIGDSLELGKVYKPLKQRIIGVVQDHYFASLETKIAPMLIWPVADKSSAFLFKIQPGKTQEVIAVLEKEWHRLAPDQPFDYTFLDENVAGQYQAYHRWMGIIGTSAGFAVFISCLGLFGLSGLNTVNRTKEIGIRKVLGAGITHIFLLLNKEIIRLAILAFLLAIPVSGYLMNSWLQDFAYRISLSWEVFALAGLIGLSTAVAAVSFYSLKAVMANPVKALRNE